MNEEECGRGGIGRDTIVINPKTLASFSVGPGF